MVSLIDQISEDEKSEIVRQFTNGKTHQEIGDIVGKQRRTIMKICKVLNLTRSRQEAASLKNSSRIDNDENIRFIKENRDKLSLRQIADKLNSSISAVHRICSKYDMNMNIDVFKQLQSERMRASWTVEKKIEARNKSLSLVTPELRKNLSDGSKRLWRNNDYKITQSIERAKQNGRVSSLQCILYSILDDLNVKYFREYSDKPNDPETIIGPYNFDCAIPRTNDILLVECHGDYWHSLDKTIKKDIQKSSYIANNFRGTHKLVSIWEHEFQCQDKIAELLKYWLGIKDFSNVDFEFSSVSIREIPVNTSNILLDKYHYLSGCGRGGIIFGAFLGSELIAVCVFSSLVRQNLPYENSTTRELSRFCIHPKYRKKNFGTWFMSRAIKMLPNRFKLIVSYCDTTFNHDGALYKACNFRLDGTVKPDYWYVSKDGWVMGKKKLYSKAVQMKMKEREYADIYGYSRIYGDEKLRFLFER